MDQIIFKELNKKSDEFGSIARKVNESSKKRKTYANEVIKYINLSLNIGEELIKEIKSVQKEDNEIRDKNNIVLSKCQILELNTKNQLKLLAKLKSKKAITPEINEQITAKIKYLDGALKEAVSYARMVIKNANEIILMGDHIIMLKLFQEQSARKLKELALKSLADAERAIEGSGANLQRGLKMVAKLKSVQTLINRKDKKELNSLLVQATTGWKTAVKVNESSLSQYEFAEKVSLFTKQLHKESVNIKNLVIAKHHRFEDNLQLATVLTVILDLKFKKYLEIESIIKNIEIKEIHRDIFNDLFAYIQIACNEVKTIGVMNFDMADCSHSNNELEDRTVKSTQKEVEYYDSIKKEVLNMTKATAYPIEGSGANIGNGKILEKNLKKIISCIK